MTTGRNKIEISEYSWTLTDDAVAVKGEVACLDTSTGLLAPVSTSTTLLPVGRFAESMTGDGSTKCRVQLPDGVTCLIQSNDSAPNNIAADDVGNTCYMKDGSTVSTLSTGRSAAGVIVDYLSAENKVAVLFGLKVAGATGAGSVFGSVADTAAIKAIGSGSRANGQIVQRLSDGALFRFVAASSVATDVAEELVIIPTSGTGRWIRVPGAFTVRVPIAFGMADGATILTVPTGYVLRLTGLPFWDVTTGWTGGSSSTIGVASTHTGYSTAGDILGGAAGDATAVLGTAGVKAGTIGPKLDTLTEIQAFFLDAGESLTYEEITSAYTAGAGFVCLPVSFSVQG